MHRISLGLLALASFCAAVDLVDLDRIRVEGDPALAIVQVTVPARPREIACDVLVAGGGAGGVASALTLAERSHRVCLTEETDWLGGQFNSVPALDEHKFIELAGGTRSYTALRDQIRLRYKRTQPLTAAARAWENFNPGACYVSSLCYEPRVALGVIDRMLAPHAARIQRLMRTRVFELTRDGDRITSALAYRFDAREVVRLKFGFVLDATETGELLPLAKVPYVVGSESKNDTNEPNAPDKTNPACVQSFTYTFALEKRPAAENHAGTKPPDYERIRDHQPFGLTVNYPAEFGWRGAFTYRVFGEDAPIPNNMSPAPFFNWRRLVAAKNFAKPVNDVALMNWPRQDYHDESLLDQSPGDTARILQAAKRVAAAFLHWVQTDVPRDKVEGAGGPDAFGGLGASGGSGGPGGAGSSGKGYPNLLLRKDVMGSADGFSKYPYIRESRRLKTAVRVLQQDIVIDDAAVARARWFDDSIGIGFYMVDIHPCGANERGRMMMPKPFQVPMAALVPQGVTNLLAAGKNLGVTHLTNGAFRLHPIEWNIGESAAVMASLALRPGGAVREGAPQANPLPPVRALPSPRAVQRELAARGVATVWFDDLPVKHPAFTAIQWAAIRGLYPLAAGDLHASPDAPITRDEVARSLARLRGVAVEEVVKRGWMAVDHRNWFHGGLPLYWTDVREGAGLPPLAGVTKTGPVTRAEWARRLLAAGVE